MKRITLFVLISLLFFVNLFASPTAINFNNLPDNKKFNDLVLSFVNAYDSISYPDFQNADSKKADLNAAKKLYNYLKKQKNKNYDEELLELLALRCLYNFDKISATEVQNQFSLLEEEYPQSAEHHWIYGNFLTTAALPLEGKEELEKYIEMKENYVSFLFLQDYAYNQLLCAKPLNAYYTLTNGGSIPEEQVQNQQLLKLIKGNIKESSVYEAYKAEDVWKISKTDDTWSYIYSTMLGFKFPCKGNWNLKYEAFSPSTPAFCLLTPNDFTLNDKPLSISLLFMLYPESYYNESVKDNILNSMPVINKEQVTIARQEFEKYDIEDLSKYQDGRNGARTYLYFSKISPGQYSGLRCECPIDYSQLEKGESSDSPKYYAAATAYKRLNEPVYLIMLVDTCNAVLEETDALLEELFSKAVFE